jgi:excisionase family DNA binding protein
MNQPPVAARPLPETRNPQDLTDIEGVARHLNVSKRYVQSLIRHNAIPSYSLGRRCRRFDLGEVRATLDRLYKIEPRPAAE